MRAQRKVDFFSCFCLYKILTLKTKKVVFFSKNKPIESSMMPRILISDAVLISHVPCPVAVAISSYHKPSCKFRYAYEGPTVFGSPGAQFVYSGT